MLFSESPPKAPPRISSTDPRSVRWRWWLGGMLLLGGGIFYWFNPAEHSFFPGCQFYQVSGLLCPGCGGQRALHHLLHGQFGLALQHNALWLLLLPLGCGLGLRWLWPRFAGPQLLSRFQIHHWLWISAALVLGFTVVRNLPGCEWLRP